MRAIFKLKCLLNKKKEEFHRLLFTAKRTMRREQLTRMRLTDVFAHFGLTLFSEHFLNENVFSENHRKAAAYFSNQIRARSRIL